MIAGSTPLSIRTYLLLLTESCTVASERCKYNQAPANDGLDDDKFAGKFCPVRPRNTAHG